MSEADKNKIRELERELADLRRAESEKETAKKPVVTEKPVKKKSKK